MRKAVQNVPVRGAACTPGGHGDPPTKEQQSRDRWLALCGMVRELAKLGYAIENRGAVGGGLQLVALRGGMIVAEAHVEPAAYVQAIETIVQGCIKDEAARQRLAATRRAA